MWNSFNFLEQICEATCQWVSGEKKIQWIHMSSPLSLLSSHSQIFYLARLLVGSTSRQPSNVLVVDTGGEGGSGLGVCGRAWPWCAHPHREL